MKKKFNGSQALNKALKVRNKDFKADIRHNSKYCIYFRNVRSQPKPRKPVPKRK